MTDEQNELVEKYLSGQLTEREKALFLEQLSRNPELEENLNIQSQLQEVLEPGGIEDFRQLVTELVENETKRVKRQVVKWFRWVAMLILLVTFAFVINELIKPTDGPELAWSYYTPYPNTYAQRGQRQQVKNDFVKFYEAGEFNKAIELYTDHNWDEPWLQFYLGLCYFNVEEYGLAIESLLNTAAEADPQLLVVIRWYLALAYIANEQKDQALTELKELVAQSTSYAAQSRSLIDKLK